MTMRRFQRGARSRSASGRPESGFTLIEVLVSLALLALLLALLAGGLRYARSTWDATARLDRLADADMAETFLRARLAEAMPLYEQRRAGTVRALFQGAGDSMSFVAPAPNGPAGTGLYRYTLEAAGGPGQGRHTLVVKLVPHLPSIRDSALERPPEQYQLMRNIRSVSFRYFGRGELRGEPAWHAVWPRTDAMPNLVEIAIARDDSEGGSISLTIGLRLQAGTRWAGIGSLPSDCIALWSNGNDQTSWYFSALRASANFMSCTNDLFPPAPLA
jgi:general secretion pathway protein J